MIVESSKVINKVTDLAERWKALALEPFEVDAKIVQGIIQVTKVKTELRLMLSMLSMLSMSKAAEAIRQGEKDPLQWILEELQVSEMEVRRVFRHLKSWPRRCGILQNKRDCGLQSWPTLSRGYRR